MLGRHPIVPKNPDGIARIISIGRLSRPKSTKAETQQSLDAIRVENERLIRSVYTGPLIINYLAEQASGMLAQRESMQQLWELVESGEWDLVIAEDLSRVFRNPRFQWGFIQDCVDAGIRVIAFADSIDTSSEDWETTLACATLRHGLVVPDTRRRIKRTATESFRRGGMTMKTKAFYAKVSKEDAEGGTYGPQGLGVRRLPEFDGEVDKIRRELLQGRHPRLIVARLNFEEVPCGDYVTSGRWTPKVFKELVCDPILHGTRTFRDVVHTPIYRTGKYRRDKNENPDMEYCPTLAFMTRAEQEAMLARVQWSIDWGGKKSSGRLNPRKGIPRYMSCWPGQSSMCGICGGIMYLSGKFLKCKASFGRGNQTCWNHVLAPIAMLREVVVEWLVKRCHDSDDFRQELLAVVKQQLAQQQSRRNIQRDASAAKIKELANQERNLRKSIRVAEPISEELMTSLVNDLAAVTKELAEAQQQARVEETSSEIGIDCDDREILERLPQLLAHLLATSFDMADVVRGFVPRCVIVPVQALDSGQVHPRAKLQLRGNLQDSEQLDELVVDLFKPPVHVRIMPDVVQLRGQKPRPTYKQIGKALNANYMSVKRALSYAKRMEELGGDEPFRELSEKPLKVARWRDEP